jgi:hypothetical protein
MKYHGNRETTVSLEHVSPAQAAGIRHGTRLEVVLSLCLLMVRWPCSFSRELEFSLKYGIKKGADRQQSYSIFQEFAFFTVLHGTPMLRPKWMDRRGGLETTTNEFRGTSNTPPS